MSTYDDAVAQISAQKNNDQLNPSIQNSDFYRLAAVHFSTFVWPELKVFESHLKEQSISVNLMTVASPLRATLAIEYPENVYNVLNIKYDFPMRSLVFEYSVGANETEAQAKFSLAQFKEVTCDLTYDLVQEFLTTAFNADSLCEYNGESEEPEY